MIIKGRSPSMRHVSRSHSVALNWLFDRINLDPKIQIKYVDTRNQLADILTKGTFTRDEWHHLLRARNHFNELTSLLSCRTVRRRKTNMEDTRVSAKSRPTRNLVAFAPNQSSLLPSSSQVWVLEAQGDLSQRIRARATRQLLKCGRQIQTWTEARKDPLQDPASGPPANLWPTTTFPYRQKIGRLWKGSSATCARNFSLPEEDPMDQLINEAIWRTFMNACVWASVHLDKDQDQNFRVLRNTDVFEIQQKFSITQNRIHSLEIEEVFRLNTIEWGLSPWRSCTLVHDHIVKQIESKSACLSRLSAVPRR